MNVCCVHGDNTELPPSGVYIKVHNQPYLMKAGVAQNLPYPVLISTDLPVLAELLQETAWHGVVRRAQARRKMQFAPH